MTEKHGAWISELAENGWKDTICSVCGWTFNDDIHVSLDYLYCPSCGSRMDLKAKDERKRIYRDGGKMKDQLEKYRNMYQ